MRRDTQGHVAEPREPTGHLDGARWRGRVAGATRVHVNARVAPRGVRGAGKWRAHELVGPGNSIGAVMHLRITTPRYIHDVSPFFFRVGLCSCEFYYLHETWCRVARRMQSRRRRGLHRVDSGPPDLHHKHLRKMKNK